MHPTSPKTFCSMPKQWETSGNPLAHAILRGGLDASGKNSSKLPLWRFAMAAKRYSEMGLQQSLSSWQDTNHDNSGKQLEEHASWEKPWWTVLGTRIWQFFSSWFHDWILSRRWSKWTSGLWSSITDPAWVGKHRPWSKKLQRWISKRQGRKEWFFSPFSLSVNDTEAINKIKTRWSEGWHRYRIDRCDWKACQIRIVDSRKSLNWGRARALEELSGKRKMEYLTGRWSAKEAFRRQWEQGVDRLVFKS